MQYACYETTRLSSSLGTDIALTVTGPSPGPPPPEPACTSESIRVAASMISLSLTLPSVPVAAQSTAACHQCPRPAGARRRSLSPASHWQLAGRAAPGLEQVARELRCDSEVHISVMP